MSHLTYAMSWSRSRASSGAEHVRVRVVGRARSSTSWCRPSDRLVAGGGERPLRMGAVEVAVGVDHLGLDPDAELHAEAADVLDERSPDRRGTPRTTPTSRRDRGGRRVANRTSRRRGRTVRCRRATAASASCCNRSVSWSKYDGLPRVEQHGSRAVDAGMVRRGPNVVVERPRRRRETLGRVRGDHPRRLVALAGLEAHLAGMEELAELQVTPAVRQALRDGRRGSRSTPGARPTPRRTTRPRRGVAAQTSGGARAMCARCGSRRSSAVRPCGALRVQLTASTARCT